MRDPAVKLDALNRVGRALSDPTRAQILMHLSREPAYPAELAALFGSTRANLSNHLTCLRGCGLISAVREGRNVRYELADERLAPVIDALSEIAEAEHCDYCDGRRRRSA
jgi:DNA-binding transcriptional ArsR family regulator